MVTYNRWHHRGTVIKAVEEVGYTVKVKTATKRMDVRFVIINSSGIAMTFFKWLDFLEVANKLIKEFETREQLAEVAK